MPAHDPDSRAALPAHARMRTAFDAHRPGLLRVLTREGVGTAQAEDLAQEAFFVLARRLEDVAPRAERAFLLATARHLASDWRQNHWQTRVTEPLPLELADGQLGDPRPDDVAEARLGRSLIDEALATLDEPERDVFVLADLEEMSRSEIARMLSIPAGTVASRLGVARARFGATVRRATGGRVPSAALSRRNVAASVMARDEWAWYVDGRRRFESNPWGAAKAPGRFEQRLLQRRRAGRNQIGWSWRWPGLDWTSFAYPEVLVGWKPWFRGEPPTDPRFPMAMDQAYGLSVAYQVETRAIGSYNLAAMVWLIDRGTWSPAAGAETISKEVMFWVDHSPGATPRGRLIDVATVDGTPYELWLARDINGELRPGRGGWTMLTFRGPAGLTRGVLRIGSLLGQLAGMGLVRREESVASVELGNEIMGGAGATWVHQFDVRVA